MVVKFKKLHPHAVLPEYAKLGDAGLDLTATTMEKYHSYLEYNTGLAVEIPEGYVGMIFPRSSISNTSLTLANSVGIIDSGYRGEIKVRFRSPHGFNVYKPGDRIAQLIILPYPQITPIFAEELTNTSRGEKGFGSTG